MNAGISLKDEILFFKSEILLSKQDKCDKRVNLCVGVLLEQEKRTAHPLIACWAESYKGFLFAQLEGGNYRADWN